MTRVAEVQHSRVDTWPPPIQVMIAGAAKAGTTSLKNYLGQHPRVCTHEQRGITFFAHDSEYVEGYEQVFPNYFDYDRAQHAVIVAKSIRVMYSTTAMQRLRDHNPDIYLVLLLRHPVDRAYSDYWYARRRGWEYMDSFEAALEAGPERFADPTQQLRCAYLDRSLYVKHLKAVLTYFDREQIIPFLSEDLRTDAAGVCRTIYGLFDELDTTFTPQVEQHHNTAARPRSQLFARFVGSSGTLETVKRVMRWMLPASFISHTKTAITQLNEQEFTPPEMRSETRQYLLEYFRPYNRELGELLGRDFDVWSQ